MADRLARRPLLRAVGAASGIGLSGLLAGPARADHETEPCPVAIDFNRAHVARVFDVAAAGLTELTVFYFDRDGVARKREGLDPTTDAEYGDSPLRVRYDADEDKTTLQVGGEDAAIRRVVAFGPDCRSATTNPLDGAAGENEGPVADFTWSPDPAVAGRPVTFTSTATDPDGELIHHGWDFDADGVEDATGTEVTHAFAARGEYAVTHTVVDDFDATDSVTKSVPVRWAHVATFSPDDATVFPNFGASVALDGDTAVVGAINDLGAPASDTGTAYVFVRDGEGWTRQAKVVGDDVQDDDLFGSSVAVDGDTAVVGAHRVDEQAGAAYAFVRSGETWSQQEKLLSEDVEEDDVFGSSVAVDGDTALVGAMSDENSNGRFAGAAYAFVRDGGDWTQETKLVPDDGDDDDLFGSSVALDGDTALVGARRDEDPGGDHGGSAYAFVRSGETWSEQAKLPAGDGDAGDEFGTSVALDGDTAVVGAPGDEDPNGDDAGSAYVFVRSGSSWSRQAKLVAHDGDAGDRFGTSLAVDGATAIVGAVGDEDPNGTDAGSAYVFVRDGGTWNRGAKLVVDGDADDRFGGSVALEGDTALVGARGAEDFAGSAFVFRE